MLHIFVVFEAYTQSAGRKDHNVVIEHAQPIKMLRGKTTGELTNRHPMNNALDVTDTIPVLEIPTICDTMRDYIMLNLEALSFTSYRTNDRLSKVYSRSTAMFSGW